MSDGTPMAPPEPPTYPLDLHDFIGVALGASCAILINLGNACGVMANEFYASARHRRLRKSDLEQRRRNDEDFLRMVSDMTPVYPPDAFLPLDDRDKENPDG